MNFWEAAINVYDRIRNYFEEEEDEDTDEERYQEQMEESKNRFRLTREDALNQFDQAFQLQRQAMNQTQSNYENATQIRAADMQAVGLNPLNLVGGAEGQAVSSSLSPSASALNSALPFGRKNSNPQVSGTGTAAGLLDYYFRHKENEADRKNSKDIAQIQADASRYSSDRNAETAYALLEQRKAEFSDNISLAFAEHDEKVRANKVREELERIGLSNEQAKIKADKIAHDEEIRRAYEQLELEKQRELRAKTQEEKRIAAQKQRTWLMFIGDRIDNLVDLGKSIFLGSSSGSGHRRGIGFGNDEGW